jgi:Protein of unknown function (DUF3830)
MADSIAVAGEQNPVTRPKGVRIEFVSGEAARFEFLWGDAPDTCGVLSEKLPAQGDAIHAIYSGTQVGVLFDPSIDAPLQNATTSHMPGDLIWMHYPALSRFGHPDAVSEICWAYDRHTRMVMPGQFVQIAGSVFATFAGGTAEWSAFAARSAQIRWDGKAQVRISMY